MDFTTKKILNNGIYMLSTIYGFLNAITCLIIQYLNIIVATNILQNNFQRTFSSKSESATSTTTTTKRSFIFSSKSESSTSAAAPPPLSTAKTRTRTSSIFSSKFESSTSVQLPPPPAITRRSPFSSLFDSTPYSSPWMYSTSGDLIGSESGYFMASTSELEGLEQQWDNTKSNNNIVKKRKQPEINVKKEYPPPIPSWRGKLPGDVPWSLSRHHVDGRLILKEQIIEYYEYLEAKRENGHLMLNLVVLKGNIRCHDDQNDLDDTIHDDEITCDDTINRGEKKKRIQEEIEKDFKMINGDLGTKKRRTILAI